MRKYEVQPVPVQSDVICDICCESCIRGDGDLAGPEYLTMKAGWGWNSHWDGERWEADVCIDCVRDVLEPLVHFRGRPEKQPNSTGLEPF